MANFIEIQTYYDNSDRFGRRVIINIDSIYTVSKTKSGDYVIAMNNMAGDYDLIWTKDEQWLRIVRANSQWGGHIQYDDSHIRYDARSGE